MEISAQWWHKATQLCVDSFPGSSSNMEVWQTHDMQMFPRKLRFPTEALVSGRTISGYKPGFVPVPSPGLSCFILISPLKKTKRPKFSSFSHLCPLFENFPRSVFYFWFCTPNISEHPAGCRLASNRGGVGSAGEFWTQRIPRIVADGLAGGWAPLVTGDWRWLEGASCFLRLATLLNLEGTFGKFCFSGLIQLR